MGVGIDSVPKTVLDEYFLGATTVLREKNGPDKNGWAWFPKEVKETDSLTSDALSCVESGINVHSLLVSLATLVNGKEWEVVHRGFKGIGVDVPPVGIYVPETFPPHFTLDLFVKGPSETSYSKVSLRVGDAYAILPYGRIRAMVMHCEDSNQENLKVVIFQPTFKECVSMDEVDMRFEEFLTNGETPGGSDVFKRPSSPSELVVNLCASFYSLGWCSGSGGSISIRFGDLVFMTPSGVQKERLKPDDIFVLDAHGTVLQKPAGAVIHSHGMECVIVTLLDELRGKEGIKEFRCTHLEMIKGLAGHGYHDELVIPIIENAAFEHELSDSLAKAMDAYPKAQAVLVHRHGIYVWGETWEKAKIQCECLHYLFDAAARMHQLGIDPSVAPPSSSDDVDVLRSGGSDEGVSIVLMDIEGTTTPISYIKDTLFPISSSMCEEYLSNNHFSRSIMKIAFELQLEAAYDVSAPQVITLLNESCQSLRRDIIDEIVANVVYNIRLDHKSPPLKALQGRIWSEAYSTGRLKAELFPDVAESMKSGSREAQELLFRNTIDGDMTGFISAYFDLINAGPKRLRSSYEEIALTLGVRPHKVLFLTDVLEEARAASEAGMRTTILVRPGNAPIEEGQCFNTATDFNSLSELQC